MPHHALRPLRKRSPWIGSRPGVFVALPARRPRPVLIVAAATALLPRPLPAQPKISRPFRPTPPPGAQQRQPNVSFRTTPALLLNRGGQVLITPPHRPTVPRVAGLEQPLVVVPNSPAVLFNRGGRTVALSPRRPTPPAVPPREVLVASDRRGFAGRALLGTPSRTAAPVPPTPGSLRTVRVVGGRGRISLPIVPGTGTAVIVTPGAAGLRTAALPRPVPPRRPGQVFLSRVAARTVRLAAFQTGALLARRDERGFAGRVLLTHVPSRTVRLGPAQTAALVRLRPYPEPRRGSVFLAGPHRDTAPRPAKRPLIVSPVRPPLPGAVWQDRSLARTLRLGSFQVEATVIRRDERRFSGRVILGTPSRTGAAVVIPTTAKLSALVVRRDERRFAGAVFTDRVPARTVRLASFQERALVVRRDERRYPGAVVITHVPARTVRLAAFELAARVVPPPPREARRGSLLVGSPHRDSSPRPVKRVLTAAPIPPRPGGSVFTVRVPSRTVRLTPVQLTAGQARRDERRFAGRVLLAGPSRTGTAVVVPRTPRHVLARRDERSGAGRVILLRVPDRTVRLTGSQEAARLIRRDERRYAGAVLISHVPARTVRLAPFQMAARVVPTPVPLPPSLRSGAVRLILPPHSAAVVIPPTPARLARVQVAGRPEPKRGAVLITHVPSRTVRLAPFQVTPKPIRRDQRGFAGSVLFTGPHRTTDALSAGRRVALISRRDERRGRGQALFISPRRATFRLTPGQLKVTAAQRATPRPGGTPGAVLFVRPARPRIVPRLPRHLIVRRDERSGRASFRVSPPGRLNATIVTHGNPRAGLTQRAGPSGGLSQRPGPAATLTLRRPSGNMTFDE